MQPDPNNPYNLPPAMLQRMQASTAATTPAVPAPAVPNFLSGDAPVVGGSVSAPVGGVGGNEGPGPVLNTAVSNSAAPRNAVSPATPLQVIDTSKPKIYTADDIEALSRDMTEAEALAILAAYLQPTDIEAAPRPNICDWAEKNYFLAPGSSTESHSRIAMPIRLLPHQKCLLNFFFHHPSHTWTTILYSTVKKSGKTAIGGLVARYMAENSGHYAEVYCMANDQEQARGRIYKAATDSIENTPGWDDHKRVLYMQRGPDGAYHYGHERKGKDVLGTNPSVEVGWRIVEREAQYRPTKSFMRALANDFRGESGANPTATVWSEIWGLVGDKSKRLWGELTPVPTRPSIRFVETYAGFEDESDILMDVWNRCKKEGRQLTRDEMPDWPWDEDPPVWINEEAQTCGYIDQGERARRMPWQTPAYYAQQEHELKGDPVSFNRFHLNFWGSTVSELMPLQWYKDCNTMHELKDADGVIINTPHKLPPLRKNERVVVAVDASVSRDYSCAGIIRRIGPHTVAIHDMRIWKPPSGGKIDYKTTIEKYLRECAVKYNVTECCYDGFQMHKLATDLAHEYVLNMVEFSQGSDRMKADYQLIQCFAERDILYDTIFIDENGNDFVEAAITSAAAQRDSKEDTKLRIVKRAKGSHIDPLIVLSMGTERALYLNLGWQKDTQEVQSQPDLQPSPLLQPA